MIWPRHRFSSLNRRASRWSPINASRRLLKIARWHRKKRHLRRAHDKATSSAALFCHRLSCSIRHLPSLCLNLIKRRLKQMRGCLNRFSMISTSKGRLLRCGQAQWSPCTNLNPRLVLNQAVSFNWPKILRATCQPYRRVFRQFPDGRLWALNYLMRTVRLWFFRKWWGLMLLPSRRARCRSSWARTFRVTLSLPILPQCPIFWSQEPLGQVNLSA